MSHYSILFSKVDMKSSLHVITLKAQVQEVVFCMSNHIKCYDISSFYWIFFIIVNTYSFCLSCAGSWKCQQKIWGHIRKARDCGKCSKRPTHGFISTLYTRPPPTTQPISPSTARQQGAHHFDSSKHDQKHQITLETHMSCSNRPHSSEPHRHSVRREKMRNQS